MTNPEQVSHIFTIFQGSAKQSIVLDEQLYSIGRDRKNSIVIPSKFISRIHALLFRFLDSKTGEKRFRIIDGSQYGRRSLNAIFINDQICHSHVLRDGDTIRFGNTIKAYYQVIPIKVSGFLDYLNYERVESVDRVQDTNHLESALKYSPKTTISDIHLYRLLEESNTQQESDHRHDQHRTDENQSFLAISELFEA